MLKCGAGTAALKDALKRSKVIEQLKEKLVEASTGSAVADQGIAPIADGPMNILDDVDSKESPSKKMRYAPRRLGHQVVEIKMHERPTQCVDSAVAGTRKVRVLARSTNQLWIAVDDVEWLINYVAAEVALGGVPELEVAAVAAGNCEVHDLRMSWDFGNQSWRAEFVAGKLKGTSVSSSVSKMNAEKWTSVASAVAVEFEKASFEDRKEGTRLFLQAHCATLPKVEHT